MMIDIKLTDKEAAELREVLTSYVSDLRMEITDTEKYEFREKLKNQKTFLVNLIDKLNGNHT